MTSSTSTLPSTESEVEASALSTMDAGVTNTSFELCSILWFLKRHGESKQTQAVKPRRKIIKTANTQSKAHQ